MPEFLPYSFTCIDDFDTETHDENHGRIENRRYWTTDHIDDFADWRPGRACACIVRWPLLMRLPCTRP